MKKLLALSLLGVLSISQAVASPGQCDGIVTNPDHSVAITGPRLDRGDESLPLTNNTGVCALFGYDTTLTDLTKMQSQTILTVGLNADGSFNNLIPTDSSFVSEITCAHSNGFVPTEQMNSSTTNPDHSHTFIQPRLSRGDDLLPLTNNTGVCALFGYNQTLTDLTVMQSQTGPTAALNTDGMFANMIPNDSSFVQAITCVNAAEFAPAKSADQILRNLDNSFTFKNPKLLRGNVELPLTNGTGVCALFGFASTMDDQTLMVSATVQTAALAANGSFDHLLPTDSSDVGSVTCYDNQNLQLVGQAGQVIYYHWDGVTAVDEEQYASQYGIVLKKL